MDVLVFTDKNIEGNEAFTEHVRAVVQKHLGHWSDRITRVEVHVGGENGQKNAQREQRCVMEARPRGLKPLAVTHHAANQHLAIEGAVERLVHLVGNHFGKLADR